MPKLSQLLWVGNKLHQTQWKGEEFDSSFSHAKREQETGNEAMFMSNMYVDNCVFEQGGGQHKPFSRKYVLKHEIK